LREEHRLRVFENRGSEIGIGSKREEETGENFTVRSFMIGTACQILLG
jgi:hypothetical protein